MIRRTYWWNGVREHVWRLRHTTFWSGKRPLDTLHNVTKVADEPMHWRRLISRPGWFIAFVRYEPRK
ncbi:gp20 [Streptomyces phage phiSASD1]|uniref:Gp20 n=1 Tax=Streptomyces phage phiSASD1 TaxID=747763 RepID=D7NW89_9CAUD|nr:gp20 [Streptomyces phage phiSASD1]ADE43487.1 gp20 [Streptomyces phage phiSASD1]